MFWSYLIAFVITVAVIFLLLTLIEAIAGAWNSQSTGKIELGSEFPETQLFDWERDFE